MDGNNYYQQQNQNNYYQNLYNMFGGYNPLIDGQARSVRRLGLLAGTAMILYIIAQKLFVIALYYTKLIKLYQADSVYTDSINIFAQVIYIFIPFFVIYLIYKPKEKAKVLAFEKPSNPQLAVYAIFAGMGVCVIANFAADALSTIFTAGGIEFLSGTEDTPTPKNAVGVFMMILSNAVAAPMFEEFALRGIIMQPLRKHGDKFAIVASALIFAVLHGNMVQAPFAFIAGLGLGYFCIVTNSLWVSMAIHCLNNLSATLFSLYMEKNPDAGGFAYFLSESVFLVIGIVAYLLFRKHNTAKLKKSRDELSGKLRMALYFCAPTVVIGLINALYSTFSLQTTTKAFGMLMSIAILVVICVFLLKGIGLIKMDTRLTQDRTYSVSKAFTIIMLVFGTVFIIVTAGASMLTGMAGN